jgi:hypothetical protein
MYMCKVHHQGGTTWIVDIGVVCPDVDQGSQTTPGRAAEAYAAIKAAKYPTSSHSSWRLEATSIGGPTSSWTPYGRGLADSRTQGHFRGPSPQDVALRGVMQALVRVQAYELADIVAAIPAVDLAARASPLRQ